MDDEFSKHFKSYLGEDIVYNFINGIPKESKHPSDLMKKQLKQELVMAKKGDEDFKNSTKCWICDNNYDNGHAKVRDHYHITWNIDVLHIEIVISKSN